MAGFKSTDQANKDLDSALGSGTPATYYVALMTAAPTAAGGGTELAMTGYARVAVTNNSTNFPAASGGSKSTGVDINFGTLTGTSATVVGVAICDASSGALTGSNFRYYGPLSVSRTISSGDSFDLPIGSGTFTEA